VRALDRERILDQGQSGLIVIDEAGYLSNLLLEAATANDGQTTREEGQASHCRSRIKFRGLYHP
jgi:hypothetical protein